MTVAGSTPANGNCWFDSNHCGIQSQKQQTEKQNNMDTIKQAFNYSFEQVSTSDHEPEFAIHGIGYRGKWGKDTMAIFIKDLEAVEEGMSDDERNEIAGFKEEIKDLSGQVDGLSGEVTDLEEENDKLEDRITELNNENIGLKDDVEALREEVESLRIANTAMAGNLTDADSKITKYGLLVAELEEEIKSLNEELSHRE